MKLFVFAATNAVSKSGSAYQYQPVQIMQGPNRPDAFDRLFVNEGSEPLEPGAYTADAYIRSTPTGNRVSFDNFVKAD